MHIHELYPDAIFENEDFEFKARLDRKNTIGWGKTLAAFANGKGGYLFIGCDDDGMVQGLTYEDVSKTKLQIQEECERHILNPIKYKFKINQLDDSLSKFVLSVKVEKANELVKYNNGDYDKIVFIRKDGQTVKASPEEIIELSNKFNSWNLDERKTEIKFKHSNFSSFFNACKTYREDHTIPADKRLIDCNAVTENKLLTYGASLFEDNCKDKNTLITCHLYAGFDKSARVLDHSEFVGNLISGYEFMKDFIDFNKRHGFEKTENGGRKEIISYPDSSIDEALINSLAHRDYSINGTQIDVAMFVDRIDIYTPGSWLLEKNPEEYDWSEMPSKRRNGIICDIFALAGLMEKGGTGFRQMYQDYKDHKEKFPIFKNYGDFSVLTLFDLSYEEPVFQKEKSALKETEENYVEEEIPFKDKILKFCLDLPRTRSEIQSLTQYSSPQSVLSYVINPLLKQGLLIPTKSKNSPKQSYITNKKLYKGE